MDVTYGDRKVGKVCASDRDMQRTYGPALAKKIGQRLAQLRAAETLEDMRPCGAG